MIEKTNSRCSSNSHRESQLSYPSRRAPKKSIRRPRSRKAWLALAYLCLCPFQAPSQEIEFRSLPDLIEQGSQALVRGDYPTAAHTFNAIQENYQEEPIWIEGDLPAKILPLAGFASHKASLHTEAIAALESYLATYATDQDSEIFARFTLASSLLLDGNETAARKAFSELRKTAGHTPFRDLASLREAQLSTPKEAVKILNKIVEDPVSLRLASFARLRLIQLHLDAEDLESARIQLLDTPWHHTSMPELATLSFLASQVGNALLPANPAAALQAYRIVQAKPALILAQQDRIKTLKTTYRQLAPVLKTEQSMWTDQFRRSISTLQSQLETLRETPPYSQAVDLRKARCFALINRPIEAWVLLEPIAHSPSAIAREAHLEWISTARSMHAWNAAAEIAKAFIDTYPNDKVVPQILLWIALSQIEQDNFLGAIDSLQSILARQPEKPLLAAVHYYLGFSHFRLNNTTVAIHAFQACYSVAPELPVASQAHLWVGICQFTTNAIEQAITTFQEIQSNNAHTFLHPEAAFREATCHYALGNLEAALAQTQGWLNRYPTHARKAEAHLLHGDILTEHGQYTAAIEAYSHVETIDPQLTFIALEKQCSLLIETDHRQAALEKLQAYRTQAPVPSAYIGSYTQQLATCLPNTQAQGEIENAIKAYGNDLQAAGIVELIHLLSSPPQTPEAQSTLKSRILVAQIQRLQKQGKSSQAKLKALELATHFDTKNLSPAALIEAGNALVEIQSMTAPDIFHFLLNEYPHSHYTSNAHLGLAQHHNKAENHPLALAHLLRIQSQTPETLALKLHLEHALSQFDNARQTAQQLLAERQSKPTHKAAALLTLGNIAIQTDELPKAYAYYQRIFTLYRGETDSVARAYLACIHILETENRLADANNVASEFLAQAELQNHPSYQEARSWLDASEGARSSTPPQTVLHP